MEVGGSEVKRQPGLPIKHETAGFSEGLQENHLWASRMAQWVKMLATKPDDLSSIFGTRMVEGENPRLQTAL